MSSSSPHLESGDTPADSASVKPPPNARRRRDKVQLSCTLCRRRKLKCDREQPCGTCVHRGLSLSCTYVNSHASERLERSRFLPTTSTGIQDRIGELEKLVISLMSSLNTVKSKEKTATERSDSSSAPSRPQSLDGTAPTQDSNQLSAGVGRISLENTEANYVESAHWTAILDGIGELKEHFEEDPNSTVPPPPAKNVPEYEGSDLIFGSNGSTSSKQEILSAMPPRAVVDRLVAKCFNSLDVAPAIIHTPTFLQEYDDFWQKPMDTPLMWIGLLYAIMCSATLYQQFSDYDSIQSVTSEPSDPKRVILLYREKAIQCLVTRKYNKFIPYSIETLLFYLNIEFFRSEDTQSAVWILLGVIVHVSQRMGYHRDGSHFPRITPYQAEMRRRIWAIVYQLDVVISAAVGLPRTIRDSQCDAAEPRNLLDEDFDKDMAELPPERPATSFTAMQYLVSKNRVVAAFGLISDLETSTDPWSYTEVMRLDGILHSAYEKLPQWLILRPMNQLIMETSDAIMRRMYVSLLFYKSKCVLHRKYLLSGRTDSQYTYSRTSCIDAALQILKCQATLDQETQPGGRIYQDRWKASSLVKADFLLATTILCLDLDHSITSEFSPRSQSDIPDVTSKIILALTESYHIWLRSADSSREAQKAAEAVRIVLGKLQSMDVEEVVSKTLAVECENAPSLDPSAWPQPTSQLPPHRTVSAFMGAVTPLTGLADLPPLGAGNLADSGSVASFDFNDWDSGYQNQSEDEMAGMSANFPMMFGFPI